jgi:hypothetical protein
MSQGSLDLENSPNTNPIPHKLTNGQLKFGGLGPDAVQADAVERGQIGAFEQLLEAVVVQARATATGPRQRTGMSRLRRVEISAHEQARVGRCVNVGRHTLPKAQLRVGRFAQLRRFGGRQPIGQQAKALEHWVDLAVIAVGVAHIGEIALVPGFAHGMEFCVKAKTAVIMAQRPSPPRSSAKRLCCTKQAPQAGGLGA